MALALALPAATSWKASNISRVCLKLFGGNDSQLGVIEQFDQGGGLFGTFGDMVAVGFKHGVIPRDRRPI